MKWKTAVDDVPQGLDSKEFEDWLWRREKPKQPEHIEAGFDMVPRLTKGAVDKQNWQSFIKFIKAHYNNDELVDVKPNYIVFKAGEHLLLPFEGHKFLRRLKDFGQSLKGSRGIHRYSHQAGGDSFWLSYPKMDRDGRQTGGIQLARGP